MKLITHNMLACHIKGVKNGYPFKIEAKKVEEREAEFNPGTNTYVLVAVSLARGGRSRGRGMGHPVGWRTASADGCTFARCRGSARHGRRPE